MDKNDRIIFIEDLRRRRNVIGSFFNKIKYGTKKNKIVYAKSNCLYIHKTAKVSLNGKLYLSRNQRGILDSKSILVMQKNSKLVSKGEFSIGYGADIRLFDEATIILGKDSYINNYCLIRCADKIEIGDNCSISYNCTMLDSDFHRVEYNDNKSNEDKKPITIGNHVLIGANVTILKGVTIGNNVVIGAGSVVNRNIPDNSLAVGNPAKVKKKIKAWD